MEDQNNPEQGSRYNAAPPVSLGTMLREARERLNFSVADVAVLIKFAPRQIEALEADDYNQLPEGAFLRGFVRSYAKVLNLDAQPLLAALPQENAPAPELTPASVNVPYPVDNSSQTQTLILLGAALLLAVVVVGFSVWHFTTPLRQSAGTKLETPVPLTPEKQAIPEPLARKHDVTAASNPDEQDRQTSATAEQSSSQPDKARTVASTKQSPATATKSSTQPDNAKAVASAAQSSVKAARTRAAEAVAQSSVRAAKTKAAQAETKTQTADSGSMDTGAPNTTLRLVFDEESWAEITDKDGKMISSQINPRGSELNVKGQLPMSLVVGHAATTHLYMDGKPVDLTRYINSTSEVARITLE